MPFIRIVTGKILEGAEVSQILKSGWIYAAFSRILYSYGMNEGAKWQFCSNTQRPYFIDNLIAFSALPPWPWPKDNEANEFLKPNFSAKFVIYKRGSAPGDKIKINGVLQSESVKVCYKLNGGGSIYCFPISSLIKNWTAWVKKSGLIILIRISFLNLLIFYHFPGHLIW